MTMDEKIEEMVLAVYPWLKEVPIEERKQLRENVSGLMVMERLYNAGYRKESDTVKEVLDKALKFTLDDEVGMRYLIKNLAKEYGVELK